MLSQYSLALSPVTLFVTNAVTVLTCSLSCHSLLHKCCHRTQLISLLSLSSSQMLSPYSIGLSPVTLFFTNALTEPYVKRTYCTKVQHPVSSRYTIYVLVCPCSLKFQRICQYGFRMFGCRHYVRVCVCFGAEALWLVDLPRSSKCLNGKIQSLQSVRAKQAGRKERHWKFPLFVPQRQKNQPLKHNSSTVITASYGLYTSILSYFWNFLSSSTLWNLA